MAKRVSLATAVKLQNPGQCLLAQVENWESVGEMQMLPLAMIDPSPYQPREVYSDEALDGLAASIKETGLIQPIIVRPKDNQRYELVAGHRRWLATARTEKTTIAAIVRPLDNREAATISLMENLQREDLDPVDTAKGLQRMLDEFKLTQQDLAALLSRSKADITLTLGLLKLLPEIQAYIKQGKLTAGHGRLLYRLSHEKQRALAEIAMAKAWTVRTLERVIAQQKTASTPKADRDNNVVRLETLLQTHFAVPVRIRANPKGAGFITFRYHSLEECEAILNRFGLPPDQYQ